MQRKAVCKKTFVYLNSERIFLKDKVYPVQTVWFVSELEKLEGLKKEANTVYIANPNNVEERFIFNLDNGFLNNYFYDYFYSDIELRKLKLKKLNGI